MMPKHTSVPIIAKEGWGHSLIFLALFVCAYALSFFTWIFFALWVLVLFFYRNPERLSLEEDAHALISPADGVIKAISKVTTRDGEAWLRVVIEKRLSDVGLIRAPVAMHIMDVKERLGLPIASSSPLSRTLGEKVVLSCKSAYGEFKMALYSGQFSKKVERFDTLIPLKSTQRMAFFYEGDVALLLPLETRIVVALNDEVRSGESVLGYFAQKASV